MLVLINIKNFYIIIDSFYDMLESIFGPNLAVLPHQGSYMIGHDYPGIVSNAKWELCIVSKQPNANMSNGDP